MLTDKQLRQYKQKYAHLIVVTGLNNVKNKVCKIEADIDQAEFVEMIVRELYERGARRVEIYWTYRPVLKTIYRRTSAKELAKVNPPEIARFKYELKEYMPSIVIESWDPNWMKGVDPKKIAYVKEMHAKARAPYEDKMDTAGTPWCLAVAPSAKWAKRLFPNYSAQKALKLMWEKTLECCRCLKGDPVENWKEYNREIKARAKWLDSLHIKTLHYTNKLGTDLVVGINPHANFCGGYHLTGDNPPFNPNMPATECFTVPDRLLTEGIVYASKPLCENGQLIEDFSLRFHEGRIVEVKAKKGESFLKQLIDSEENTHYLGEVALIPYDSPVSNTKMIYYNTLFDENASCHLAFGYSLLINYDKEAQAWNDKERIAHGLNRASMHIDFMIGTEDLNIVATTRDGKEVVIFKNGNWATKI